MPSPRISKELNDKTYFLTFTVRSWYYVFDRHDRWSILADSLNYCIKNKNLKIYAYVFMLNHIHLIVKSNDVSGFIRDFKKHTARKIFENIQKFEPPVVKLFEEDNGCFRFWNNTNMPILIESENIFYQKKKYIEQNPVVKSYVDEPHHWIYSSANLNNPVTVHDTNL